eukprot:TRINITY_DN74_c0_g4_i2.p1 TRINITY_DN74_c0_g4~~TRINITY_DN74_c0_g4_i2.p1  ORF type:complete len:378 (-),score=124.84 TRINITY_DN74_c0_g4_i2:198-1331(-)
MFGFFAFSMSVFTTRGLEKNPLGQTRDVKLPVPTEDLPMSLGVSEEEKASVDALLSQIRMTVDSRRIHLKYFFQDFDKLHRGIVTKEQFRRGIKVALPLSDGEIELLVKHYMLPNGVDVLYLKFHNDVDFERIQDANAATLKATSSPLSASSGTLRAIKTGKEADVEERIKWLVKQHRIRLADAFIDFDRLRKGWVVRDQFVSSLGSVKFPRYVLTHEDLEEVANRYAGVDETTGLDIVYWREFVDNIESVFVKPGLEKNPLETFEDPQFSEAVLEHTRKALDEVHEQRAIEILEHIQQLVRSRRMLLKPVFQDFDRANKSTYVLRRITPDRFRRAMSMFNFGLTEEELDILVHRYEDGDSVDYLNFIEDVDFKEAI